MRAVTEQFEVFISRSANRFQQVHSYRLSAINLSRNPEPHGSILSDHPFVRRPVLSFLTMFFRFSMAVLLTALLAASVSAQGTNVHIQPDLRLFTMMAALNAAGFDVEFASQYHPVRDTVRKYAKDVDPDLVARLKAFYNSRKGSQTDEAQLPKYISLAVNLTDAPSFKTV